MARTSLQGKTHNDPITQFSRFGPNIFITHMSNPRNHTQNTIRDYQKYPLDDFIIPTMPCSTPCTQFSCGYNPIPKFIRDRIYADCRPSWPCNLRQKFTRDRNPCATCERKHRCEEQKQKTEKEREKRNAARKQEQKTKEAEKEKKRLADEKRKWDIASFCLCMSCERWLARHVDR